MTTPKLPFLQAMLAIFLAAVALTAFFLAKESLTSQVDRLGELVREGLINRTVERLNVQLDEGSRCVNTLQKALVYVWGPNNTASPDIEKVSALLCQGFRTYWGWGYARESVCEGVVAAVG